MISAAGPLFAIALTVTTAVQAVLIPPSHNGIIYALAAGGVSVGRLLLAGALPGILLGLSLMAMCYCASRLVAGSFGDRIRSPFTTDG